MYETYESFLSRPGYGHPDHPVAQVPHPAHSAYTVPQGHPGPTHHQGGWYYEGAVPDGLPYSRDGYTTPYDTPGLEVVEGGWEALGDFSQFLRPVPEEAAPSGLGCEQPAPHPPIAHRRRRPRITVPWPQALSGLFGALTALTVLTVSLLGWMFSYSPLQDLALLLTPASLARLWPLIVYGPWLVASLSILRATLDRRPAAQSWTVVVLFSSVAAVLCIADAPRTLPGTVVAGLPPVTAVVSFHQLVRQIVSADEARRTRRKHPSHRAPR